MTGHMPDTTPAALIARAKAEMAAGGYEAATTCALVAIAEALVGKQELSDPDTLVVPSMASIRQAEPNGYIAGIRDGLRRAARAAQDYATEYGYGNEGFRGAIATEFNRFADGLEQQSIGEIRLDKDRP